MTGPPDRTWVKQAACRDQPTRLFTDPQTDGDVRAALATCRECPVRQPCLATALNHRPEADVGIWGGTTQAQRRHLRTSTRQPDAIVATAETQAPPPPQPTPSTEKRTRTQWPARPEVRRFDAPETTVALDEHGDYVSADGRVLIFRIHGTQPWAVAIDDRFIAATKTVSEARRIAWATLHEDRQAGLLAPEPARLAAPRHGAR